MFDVICVGSSTVDVFVHTEYQKIIHDKSRRDFMAYPVGTKILIQDMNTTIGGGGTNAAVSLSRLGHKVAYLGKTGSDDFSPKIFSELKNEKVDTRLIVESKTGNTGYSIILDSIKHDRTIFAYKGSNNDLKYNEVNLKNMRTKWFYFSSMMKESFKTLERIAEYAVKNKIKIALNLSPYLAKKRNKLNRIFKKINILVLNKEEAIILVGKDKIENLLEKLTKLGPKIVSITDGNKGAYVFDGTFLYFGKPNNIKIVETTGAGDAYASSFLSGIIKKNNIVFAMKLGMTNAESVIQHHGAKNKLLRYNEVLKILKKSPIKITKRKL